MPRDVMNTAANTQNGEPDAGAVRAQVERMIKSNVFANSPQLAAFPVNPPDPKLRRLARRAWMLTGLIRTRLRSRTGS